MENNLFTVAIRTVLRSPAFHDRRIENFRREVYAWQFSS